jgi:guanine deaminase
MGSSARPGAGDPVLARDQTLFLLLMGMRETSVAEVYVQGRKLT